MKTLLALTTLLLVFCIEAKAGDTLYCSHPELCRMIQLISHENNLTAIKTESLVSISGDPHEYEPSILEIKKLISAPILLTGPSELNPWIKKINFQRSKVLGLKTISIVFDQNDYQAYFGATGEAISHFWLYPKVYCSLKNKLEVQLQNSGYSLKSKKLCDLKKSEDQLRINLKRIKMPIILTHDALLPLLINLTDDHSQLIVAIKGSGHHEEVNPKSIKKMYNALDAPKVIWIQETGINIPQNIINKMRPTDIIIKIDTSKAKDGDPFSVLNELTEKLSVYTEKVL